MKFRNFDQLRFFCLIAEHSSFTAAAEVLNLTKGALSYQIGNLETRLGFKVLVRSRQGIQLTSQGQALLQLAKPAFTSIENEIGRLRQSDKPGITIGMATYFASRWLSPRLMNFITAHPGISLRIQPLVDLSDWHSNDLDLAVRWGKGEWQDTEMVCERIFACPAVLTCSPQIGSEIDRHGIASVIDGQTLLHDRDGSVAWADWFEKADIEWAPASSDLVIPDPNVRVQAVIDGQGIGLYDRLVEAEVAAKKLYQYRSVELNRYGYYLTYRRNLAPDSPIPVFRDWIMQEASNDPALG
jgi:DNA-binding transcriptional LysR family regulator